MAHVNWLMSLSRRSISMSITKLAEINEGAALTLGNRDPKRGNCTVAYSQAKQCTAVANYNLINKGLHESQASLATRVRCDW